MKSFYVYILASRKHGRRSRQLSKQCGASTSSPGGSGNGRSDLIEKDNPEWFDLYRSLNR